MCHIRYRPGEVTGLVETFRPVFRRGASGQLKQLVDIADLKWSASERDEALFREQLEGVNLMYTSPKIIASLDATLVMSEAIGCPSSNPNC